MLPNFLIIGAMKAGTSSLYHYLRSHPEIFMPDMKELDFFVEEKSWPKGTIWYESQFNACGNARAVGEASPNYTKYPMFAHVPERIASIIPDVKLIYVLRHPVERIRSHWMHNLYVGRETRPINDALVGTSNYVQTSLYYKQIRQYLEYFSCEQLLVLTLDSLKSKRLATVRRVFKFLNVDPSFEPSNIDEVRHRTKDKRRVRSLAEGIKRLPFYDRISRLVPRSVKNAYRGLTSYELKHEPIDEDTYNRIIKAVREDVRNLAEFMDDDFDYWNLLEK